MSLPIGPFSVVAADVGKIALAGAATPLPAALPLFATPASTACVLRFLRQPNSRAKSSIDRIGSD